MIAFFPRAYSDELLYSLLSRYHQRTGNARFVFTAEELFINGKITHPSIEFTNAYTKDAMMWLTKEKAWETVAKKHTMYPAYIRFLPLERRKEAEAGVINCNGNWKNLMCIPTLEEKRYLRFCPECAKEDRNNYGETYWHREHQIQRIRICPKHGTILESTSIPIFSKSTPGLFDAESNIPTKTEPKHCFNEREIEFTKYVLDVFREPIDTENDYSVGEYLHSKLSKEYLNDSGILRRITKLYDDYVAFYANMPTMTQTYMQKIFNGYAFDVYYILQLAFFIGISVNDITHIQKTQNDKYQELYKKLAEKHNVDFTVVKSIGTGVLKYASRRVSQKSGPRSKNYEKLDKELLPKVKKIVSDIVNKEGRPEALSITKVQRLLNLPQKQLKRLPKCKSYIEKHTETQEEFWQRQVEWAVSEIEKSNGVVTISKIMKMTNIRKAAVMRFWKPYL